MLVMLSRVANSIYWLNRYIERADNIARFVDVNLNLMLDLPSHLAQQWHPLVITTGDSEFFKARYGEATAENVIQFLTFDPDYPNSILSALRVARENARSIREIISSEMWEDVNNFYLMVKDAESVKHIDMMPDLFAQVKRYSHRFAGVMDATMTHNEGWHFGKMGRLLERADKTMRILDVKYFILLPSADWVGTPLDQLQWIALLKSASAYEMYRKQQNRINPTAIAEFLILDRHFPRSINFCISQTEKSLYEITQTPMGTWSRSPERALGRLSAQLGYLVIEDVIEDGLHEFLEQMQGSINTISNEIALTFFNTEPVLA